MVIFWFLLPIDWEEELEDEGQKQQHQREKQIPLFERVTTEINLKISPKDLHDNDDNNNEALHSQVLFDQVFILIA